VCNVRRSCGNQYLSNNAAQEIRTDGLFLFLVDDTGGFVEISTNSDRAPMAGIGIGSSRGIDVD
jgi:hypothetical protein